MPESKDPYQGGPLRSCWRALQEDDPQYIVRLVGQVITLSLETVQIVKSLPELVIAEAKAAKA